MSFWDRVKAGIQIVVGGHSQGRVVVKGATANSGWQRPKQGEEWLHAYNTMPWLRANVAKIAGGVASLEWGITRTKDDNGMTIKRPDIQKGMAEYRRKALAALEEEGKTEAIFDHPFLTLWKNPCPALPGGAARKLAQVYYEIVGEVFFLVDRGPREGWIKSDFTGRPLPTALWPIPPTWVKRFPTPDRPTFEIRYAGLQMDNIPMSEVLWLKDPDPVNPYSRGVGLFNSLSDELDSDENAARMISYSFYNRNRPDVLVSLPNASDAELQAFRADWIANLQGVANTLKSHFVNVEAKVEQIGYDFREMQVIDLRQHTRDTIRQVPGTPPEILGIQDQSNRSTIEAAEYIFNRHVIEPRAEVWREFLGSQVLVEYDPRAVLDYVSPVQEDKNFTMSAVSGRPEVFRVNEVRKLAGMSALTPEEGGRLFYVNGQFVESLAQAPAPPGGAGQPGGAPAGPGTGLEHPGFEGGINVPGAVPMHLSVPGAEGSAESGLPFTGGPSAAQNASGLPKSQGGPKTPPSPGFEAAPKNPFGQKGVTKEARLAGRRFRGVPDLSPDQADLVEKWARLNNYEIELDIVTKMAPIPVSEKRPEEWIRRAIAHLGDLPTSAWDPMFGPWTEADTVTLDALLSKAYDPDQPRDEGGKWTSTGGVGGAGEGAARKPNEKRVDGDRTTSGLLHPKTDHKDVVAKLKANGGFTVNPRTGEYPKSGFMVSPYKGREKVHSGGAGATDIAEYERANADLLAKDDHFLGGWTNEGKDYLDVSVRRESQRDANRLAWENDQIAYFDLGTFTEHKTVHPDVFDAEQKVKELEAGLSHARGKRLEAEAKIAFHKKRIEELRAKLGKKKAVRLIHIKEFDPNQPRDDSGRWSEGGGGGGGAEPAGEYAVAAKYIAEPVTQPKGGKSFDPDVERDADGNGVTDAARVGVPADEVPPPPLVPRLPNLTEPERRAEEAFARAYETDPDGTADKFIEMVRAAGQPLKFEADMAKLLFAEWRGDEADLEKRAEVRATLNTALHQTADAIAKRAFLRHLDSLSPEERKKGLLVTVGGCGAGKGFALKNLAKAGFSAFDQKQYGVVWDSAGDQNATENPWLLEEAKKRGVPVTYAYVSADPELSWADETRGVVARAKDPKDGRMVDAKVFADSYALGARNHDAFVKAHKGEASFVFVRNGKTQDKIDGVPESDLKLDRRRIHDFAVKTIADLGDKIPPRIKRGALVGQRIWRAGRHQRRSNR